MIGEQIKALRTAHNMTQVQLARRLNVSKQSVSNWENNNILPSVEQVVRIAEYFGCTTDYLLEMESGRVFIEVGSLTERQAADIQRVVNDMKELNLLLEQNRLALSRDM